MFKQKCELHENLQKKCPCFEPAAKNHGKWRAKCKICQRIISVAHSAMKSKNNAFLSSFQIFLSELIGTAILMFFGCLGLFAAPDKWTELPSLQGAIVFGFTVSSIIVAFGHLSGAHVNPCITLCFLLLGSISPLTAVVYVIAQLLGGILGMSVLKAIVPGNLYSIYNVKAGPCGFCSTSVNPEMTLPRAFMLEFLLTAVLILVNCSVSDLRNKHINDSTPIKFALVVIMGSLTVGPFTGASMNPARSLAPAVLNNSWQDHWLYWVAPLSSSFIFTLCYKYIFLWTHEKNELEDSSEINPNPTVQKAVSYISISRNEPDHC